MRNLHCTYRWRSLLHFLSTNQSERHPTQKTTMAHSLSLAKYCIDSYFVQRNICRQHDIFIHLFEINHFTRFLSSRFLTNSTTIMSLTQWVQSCRFHFFCTIYCFSSRVLPQPTMTGYDREDDETINNKPQRNEVRIVWMSMIYSWEWILFLVVGRGQIHRSSIWSSKRLRTTQSKRKLQLICHILRAMIVEIAFK